MLLGKNESMSDSDDDGLWGITPDNCHPNVAKLLTDDFYWDIGDENSPLGNDTGADTFLDFREWREEHQTANPIEFLDKLLDEWQVTNDFWDITDAAEVQKLWEKDEFSLKLRDEAVIALAFGQFVIEGKVDTEPKRRALLAIERQSLPAMVERWEGFADERIERLGKMKTVLEKI